MMNLPTKTILAAFAAFAAFALSLPGTSAGQRYATPPPLVISPNQSGAMMLQLRGGPRIVHNRSLRRHKGYKNRSTKRRYQRRSDTILIVPRSAHNRSLRRYKGFKNRSTKRRYQRRLDTIRAGVVVNRANRPGKKRRTARRFDPALAPTLVNYESPHRPGTIIINTIERRLYLVMDNGKARRYGVGVGKPGFEWAGTHKVTRKTEWPSWRPPSEMIARERAKGRNIPAFMAGGPNNPLGARAMYLGSTLYRIHGSNQPWSIGKAVSSGCIRMRNQDAIDLYDRVSIGTKVVVI